MWSWRRKQADFDEEIGAHIELEAERLRAEGWSADDARWEARRRFGNVTRAQERFHYARLPAWLDALAQDIRYALRQLGRSPLFAAGVVLTLALGIGANAIVFGVVDRLLLRPPEGIAHPDEVRRIYTRERGAFGETGEITNDYTGYPLVTALREHVPAFREVAGFVGARPATLGRGAEAEQVQLSLVTGDFFDVLGARAAMGRLIDPADDLLPRGNPVAVVSDAFWRTRMGGTTDAVGREIVVNHTPLTVVGVGRRGFTGVDLEAVDVWAPVSTFAAGEMSDDWATNAGSFWIRAVGRLADGATAAQAEAQGTVALRRAVASWDQPWRDSLATIVTGSVIAARSPSGLPAEARVSLWLVGVSGIVLLVACANVANLLLARATRRRREIAVRLALGVGRARLVRQLLTETFLLALVSAVAALAVARWGGALLRSVLLPDVAWSGSPVDARVLAFAGVVTLLTALLAGLVPAVQASRPDLAHALKAGARDGGSGRSRLGRGLLVAQTALSVVLLVGAGLFVDSVQRLGRLDVGIDLPRVLLAETNLAQAGVEPARVKELWKEGARRVAALRGVERAALAGRSVPMRGGWGVAIALPGRDSTPSLPKGGPYFAVVEPGYLATIGARIVQGRALTDADERSPDRVAIVNEHVAQSYWPGHSAVGECVMLGDENECTTVVGVVQDVMLFQMVGEKRGMVYLPMGDASFRRAAPSALLVRLRDGAPPSTTGAVQRELQRLVPEMSYVSVRSFEELVAPEMRPWRLGATMFTVFGALTLLIAAVGLYSVLAYSVSQRGHEIGVRMALGARRADVVGLVVRDGLAVAVAGLLVGLALALAGGRYVESLLYATSPRDPAVLGTATVLLLVVALVASFLPARRASRVDPARALRED